MLFCGNADGSHVLPPFVVYKGKSLHSTWCKGGPEGAAYSVSASGWMESVQFTNWIKKFVDHKKTHHGDDFVVLFVDGHYSHLTYIVICLCKSNNVSQTSNYVTK